MTVRVAAASVNTLPLDFEGNAEKVFHLLRQASENRIQIIVFPELVLSGYGCEDYFWHPHTSVRAQQALKSLLPATKGMLAAIGLPLLHRGKLYNAAAVVANGKLLGYYLKQHLPMDGVHYEGRWFEPGFRQPLKDADLYWGPFVISWQGLRIGIEICEDSWRPTRPATPYNAHILLGLNASPFTLKKISQRRQLVKESSLRLRCVYAYANLLGNEAGKLLYDGESLIGFEGEIYAATPLFSWQPYELTWADFDSSQIFHAHIVYKAKEVRKLPTLPLPDESLFPLAETVPSSPLSCVEVSQEKAFFEAETLGLWDYLRKSGHTGFVVSLSGGVDSAVTTVLATHALRKAAQNIPDAANLPAPENPLPLAQRVWTVYQKTQNNSPTTEKYARQLAKDLEIPFWVWDIQPLVDRYEALVSQSLPRPLSWEKDSLVRQNIQARSRVPGIWMLANFYEALLLVTSNRSELSVGYSTMDGDTAGGLAPLAGIDKPFLQTWCVWAAQILNLPILEKIAQQEPTAELLPNQTDEKDLMPYPILNAIEFYWFHGWDEESLTAKVHALFPTYPSTQIKKWVDTFRFRFLSAQWKRERSAVGFHVDTYDVDPRASARFPVLAKR
ncbi:MAG: NAD(+) synthase [Bacteroidia bacterium]